MTDGQREGKTDHSMPRDGAEGVRMAGVLGGGARGGAAADGAENERHLRAALRRSEAALREAEARFRATFDLAPVGIAHVGLNGEWLRVNGALREITGRPREELLTLRFQDITHPDDLDTDLTHLQRLLAGDTSSYSMEKRYLRPDGSPVWVNLTVALVRDELVSGVPHYFIAVVEDIGERKEAESLLRQALEKERRVAEALQRSLLVMPPHDAFPGLSVKTFYEPADSDTLIGGDFFDVFMAEEDRIALVVGDATGKGLEAATYTAEVKFALRAFLREHPHPGVALERLNNFLADKDRLDAAHLGSCYVALALAVVDTRTGEAVCSSAGIDPPFVLHGGGEDDPGGGAVAELPGGGPLLGVEPRRDYGVSRLTLEPSDLLVMTTDGITEARSPGPPREFFGYEGLTASARDARRQTPCQSLSAIGRGVVERARQFAGGALGDDVCLLLARRR